MPDDRIDIREQRLPVIAHTDEPLAAHQWRLSRDQAVASICEGLAALHQDMPCGVVKRYGQRQLRA